MNKVIYEKLIHRYEKCSNLYENLVKDRGILKQMEILKIKSRINQVNTKLKVWSDQTKIKI